MVNLKEIQDQIKEMPHNYCDYRFENCSFGDTCKVSLEDRRFKLKVLSEGKDPWSPEASIQSVSESLAEAMQLLVQSSLDRGVDPDKLYPTPEEMQRIDEEDEKRHSHPFLIHLRDFAYEVHQFFETHDENLFTDPKFAVAYDYLGYYPQLASSKFGRALFSLQEDEKLTEEYMFIDSYLSAKISYASLIYVQEALKFLLSHQTGLNDELKKLKAACDGLVKAVKRFMGVNLSWLTK